MVAPTSSGRRFLAIVAVMTIVGLIVRFRAFSRLGLSHFDEGIYAIAGLWSVSPGGLASIDPGLIPYAPPGFPILVGLSYGLFGVSDSSAILVSVVLGAATIPVVAWLARRTFGDGAGAAASALASLSMVHIAFSRKALTDAPFMLAWLAAIGLGGRFLERPGLGRALALGLAVGVAQNFKYNGWLAGVLVILTACLGLVLRPEDRRRGAVARTFGWGAFAAIVSALVYLPWFRFVEAHGGYAALMHHHRGYLMPASRWWENLNQQLAQVHALSGGEDWGFVSIMVAGLACGLCLNGRRLVATATRRDLAHFAILLLSGAIFCAFLPNLPWWIGLGWSPWLVRDGRPAVRLLGIWFVVLSALTPFYHPYARLWLPTLATYWLVLGGTIERALPIARDAATTHGLVTRAFQRPSGLVVIAMVLFVVVLASEFVENALPATLPRAWVLDPEPTLRNLILVDLPKARTFRRERVSFEGKRLRVFARRPVAFYLMVRGLATIQLEPGLETLGDATRPDDLLLIDGVLLGHEPVSGLLPFEASRRGSSWRRSVVFEDQLDPITLLDSRPSVASHESLRGPPPRQERHNTIWLFAPREPPTPDIPGR